jgi:gluconokinase
MMGVAGCGKSSAGVAVAHALGLAMIEGDEFHPPSNVEKMRRGEPLTDDDRAGWLTALGHALQQHPDGAVLTCSALKRVYRDRLRSFSPGLRFVFLNLDQTTAAQRVSGRGGAHFFNAALVTSQFATLESPVGEPGVLQVDATWPLDKLQGAVVQWLQGTNP